MKLSTIAKASLALSIFTTGVATTNLHTTEAASYYYGGPSFNYEKYFQHKDSDIHNLYSYYSKHSFDFRYQKGYGDGHEVDVQDPYSHQFNTLSLVGQNKDRYQQKEIPNIDVFIVGEGYGYQATNYSVGGITKSNSRYYPGPVVSPRLTINHGGHISHVNFNIYKEEISLKQIDFKIRHQLIKHYGLYQNGKKSGSIIINMNDNSSHHIDLNSKLPAEKMGNVIDSRNIKDIKIEMKHY
ncbi:exotoxin beta-grasp domain-containing protein [Staphylococcus agnetis]|uniref:exotoxin beta-grasp domain-containing protein n=1 Tax=Staphylococcus agnetis TaxID=985762 RepID=UPI000D1A7943|nr:superantigen-like protein [Staphylococcus agnetis]NJH85955.1 superantigen-like protein [Staphylococcus agnetis]NJI14746.1 superantigen-like protein [Staphylococcus agnetis]PTH39385.1 superantigen-like protein [Staphylococcus agnetis]